MTLDRQLDGTASVAHRDLGCLADLPAFETGLMVEMPCCGFMFGAEYEDCVPGKLMLVFEPPRWTCPQCTETFALGAQGYLEEVELT